MVIDGELCRRDYEAELCGKELPSGDQAWPILSDALGVTRAQIPAAIAEARAKGVTLDFTADGRAILTSRAHRKAVCEALGFFDRNAGYGDATPANRHFLNEVLENEKGDLHGFD